MARKLLWVSLIVVALAVGWSVAPRETRKWFLFNFVARPILPILEHTGLFYKFMRHEVDGHTYLRSVNPVEAVRRAIAFVPEPHDIILATYIQSGTHFTQQIINQILTKGTMEFDDVGKAGHALEFNNVALQLNETVLPGGRRLLGTHLYADHMKYSPDRAKYVIVVRDPVDRLASSCNMYASFSSNQLTLNCDLMMNNDLYVQRDGWAEWVAGWWERHNEPNVLFTFYEDLKRDHIGEIHRIAKFLDAPLDEATAEIVREKSSIEYMQKHEASFRVNDIKNTFVREGVAGGGKKTFGKQQRAEIYRVYGERLKKAGSDFDMSRYGFQQKEADDMSRHGY